MINKFQTEGYNFMRYLIIGNLNSLQYRALLNCFLEDCQHFSVCSFKIHKKNLKESYNKFFEDFNYYKCDSYNFILPQHYEKGQKFYIYELNKITKNFICNMDDFFSWKLPDYPEDISFYKDKKVIFSTISHENMMIFNRLPKEIVEIISAYKIGIRPID